MPMERGDRPTRTGIGTGARRDPGRRRPRHQSVPVAAQTALTQVGFRGTEEADAPYTAILALEGNYCSDAGIVSGTTALDLQKQKHSASVSIWHGEAKGDQARAETATSTLDELMNKLIYAPAVVNALKDGSAG